MGESPPTKTLPTLITFVAYWLIGFPVSYFLGLRTELGSTGIWLGLLTGLTASGIMLYIRFNYLTQKMIAQSASEKATNVDKN